MRRTIVSSGFIGRLVIMALAAALVAPILATTAFAEGNPAQDQYSDQSTRSPSSSATPPTAPTTGEPGGFPNITVNPTQGPPGTTVTVTGSGWGDYTSRGWSVDIQTALVGDVPGVLDPLPARVVARPNTSGIFSVPLTIPESAPPGREVRIMAILGNGGSVDASFTITQSNSGSEDGSNKSNSGGNDPLGTGGGGEKSLGHNPADRNPPQNTGEGDRLEQHSDEGNLPPKRHHRSGGFFLRLAENLQSLIRDLASPQLKKAPGPTQLSPEDYNRFADLAAGCGSGVYGKFVNTKGLADGAAIAHLIRRHKYKEAVQEAILSWIPYKFIVDCYKLADDIELLRNWPTPYSRSPVGSPVPRPPTPKNTSPPSSPGPDAPSNVHIESYNGQLQWTDNSNNEDGFRIYQNGSLAGTAPANAAVYQGTLVLNCDDVLSISAYNVAGESTRVASSNKPSHLLPSCR